MKRHNTILLISLLVLTLFCACSSETPAGTTAPSTTAPSTTAPSTTVPETTVPVTTVPETTVPETTVAETTVPETTVPETTLPPIANPEPVTITFQPNNGDPVVTIEVMQNALISNAPIPEKRACDFVGWYQGDTPWDLTTDTVRKAMTLTAKWTLSEDAFAQDPEASIRAEGTDLRSCNFNVLNSSYGPGYPLSDRAIYLRRFLERYLPDVVSFQEFYEPWYDAFEIVFENSSYQLVNAENHSLSGVIHSTIAYNADKLTLLEYSPKKYLSSSHQIVCCKFETKTEDKQQFYYISTHFSSQKADTRDMQAKELVTYISKLPDIQNIPIIVAGDLNCYEVSGKDFFLGYSSNSPYTTLQTGASLSDAKYEAAQRGFVGETYHRGDGTGTRDDLTSGFWKIGPISFRDHLVNTYVSIDHILYSDGLIPLYYDTVIDEEVLYTSDHNPIYTDFQFSS